MKRTVNDIAKLAAGKLSDDNIEQLAKSLWFELQKQKKISRLDEMISLVREIRAKSNKQIIVEITSAEELTDPEKQMLEEKIVKKLDSKILPRYKVDKKLLGGLKIKLGDGILDLSWRGKLEKIKESTGR